MNILYLVQQGLLDIPILYLSRFIIRRKADYYHYLQQVRETSNWEPWLLYILQGVQETAIETIEIIEQIRSLMQQYKQRLKQELGRIYSQDLLNNLFKHPYTKIEFLQKELEISRVTASRYLDLLVRHEFLYKEKIGKSNFYINLPLFKLLREGRSGHQVAQPILTHTDSG